MNKQRKVLITITYNEMGIIIDTKAEEVAQPNLQPTCNQLATDTISRQEAIDALCDDYCFGHHDCEHYPNCENLRPIRKLPSAQSESIKCKDCGHAEERGCALFCGFWTRYTVHKGYCFKAERREENHG